MWYASVIEAICERNVKGCLIFEMKQAGFGKCQRSCRLVLVAPFMSSDWGRVCRGAGLVFAMLTPKWALRVFAGSSDWFALRGPIQSPPPRAAAWLSQSGRESRFAGRTGKLDLRCRYLNQGIPLWV
jgi:hypothetical protein